jgi:hypothetical protein
MYTCWYRMPGRSPSYTRGLVTRRIWVSLLRYSLAKDQPGAGV